MKLITSSHNNDYVSFLELLETKGQKQQKRFLLSGENLVAEFLNSPSSPIKSCLEIRTENSPAKSSLPQFVLKEDLFKKLDILGTRSNILVLEKPFEKKIDLNSPPTGLEIICPAGDPQNLGAILRSCLAFGAGKIILTQESANPFLPKALKASAGSILKLDIYRTSSLSEIRSEQLYSLDLMGEDITTFKWPKNLRLLIGEEGPGIPATVKSHKITIPTKNVESLNVATAASIALYSYANSHHRQ